MAEGKIVGGQMDYILKESCIVVHTQLINSNQDMHDAVNGEPAKWVIGEYGNKYNDDIIGFISLFLELEDGSKIKTMAVSPVIGLG